MSRHSWQGHFGPDVVSRAWPDFSAITQVVPVSTDTQEATLAAWRGTSEFLGAGVVAGVFARSRALGHVLGGRPVGPELTYRPYMKLAVYVPANAVNRVRDAVAAAGAGGIGTYTHTTFASPGTATFRPGPGSDQPLGREGQIEYADEYRLETILPRWLERQVVDAMLQVHPYEQVAYDLVPIANRLLVPQAFMGDDGTVKTAEVTRELGAWAITTGVTRMEAERADDRIRLELSRHGIAVTLLPFGIWTVPGLEVALSEVRG
ncbi:MAG: YqfO family protein [Clostridia bacterium]